MCLSIPWKSVEHVGYVQEFHLGSLKIIKTLEPQISGVAWDMGIFIEIWDNPTQYNREMTQIRKRVELSWFGINNFGLHDQDGDFTVEKDKFIHKRRICLSKNKNMKWSTNGGCAKYVGLQEDEANRQSKVGWYTMIYPHPSIKRGLYTRYKAPESMSRAWQRFCNNSDILRGQKAMSICESLELLIRKRITYSKYSSKDST